MKNDDIFKALTEIDDDIIDEGDKDKAKNHFIKWCGIAASFFVLFLAGIVWFASQSDENKIETCNKETTSQNNVSNTIPSTSTTSVLVTSTTPLTTTVTTYPSYSDPVVEVAFNSYDELKTYLFENFEGYNYYLPEVDSNVYSFDKCHMVNYQTGNYYICFSHNEDEDKNITVYATPQTEALTFDDVIEEENATLDIFVSKDNVWDTENKIYYWNDPWTEGSPYTITHITDDGLKIFFNARNDFSTEEIKAKFDEFMAAVIED